MDMIDRDTTLLLERIRTYIEPETYAEAHTRKEYIEAERKRFDKLCAGTFDLDLRKRYRSTISHLTRELKCLNTTITRMEVQRAEQKRYQKELSMSVSGLTDDELQDYFNNLDFTVNTATIELLIHAYLLLKKTHAGVRRKFWNERDEQLTRIIHSHLQKYGTLTKPTDHLSPDTD